MAARNKRRPGARPGRAAGATQRGRVRIIGGAWRGRWLDFAGDASLRPSGDRLRETLFNWLQFELPGARCLDLFAGSGALGFEAASRGAAEVALVESHPAAAAALLDSAARLAAGERVRVIAGDALAYLGRGHPAFDVLFLDPPFADSDLRPLFAALLRADLLAPQAWIYLERPRGGGGGGGAVPEDWLLQREASHGQVQGRLFRRQKYCTAT